MRLVLAVLVASAAMLAAFGWLAMRQSGKPENAAGQRPVPESRGVRASRPQPGGDTGHPPRKTVPQSPDDATGQRPVPQAEENDAPAANVGDDSLSTSEITQPPTSLPHPSPSLKGRGVEIAAPTCVPVDPADAATERLLQRAREALADDPYHPAALHDELAALSRMGRWEEALLPMCRLVELNPDDLDLLFDKAGMLLRLRQYVDVISTLNTLVSQRPDDARAWFNLAIAHQSLGHLQDARAAWDRTIQLAPSPTAHAQRGVILMDFREWAAAADDFRTVLAAEPKALDAVLNLALALEQLGQRDEARAKLTDVLEQRPRCLPVINRLAEMAATASQLEPTEAHRAELADWCRRSLEIDPNQPDMQALQETARQSP